MKKFVINLKDRPERKQHFIEKNTTLEDYTFVEAVDGLNQDLSWYASCVKEGFSKHMVPFLGRLDGIMCKELLDFSFEGRCSEAGV